MLAFDAGKIIRAIAALRMMEAAVTHFEETEDSKKSDCLTRDSARITLERLNEVSEAISGLPTKTTALAIQEMQERLSPRKIEFSYQDAADWIQTIAVTLRRELNLAKTFSINSAEEAYFDVDLSTFGPNFSVAFPSCAYELDEAGKCLALSRSTAAVFHLMRAMEVALAAARACLGIPEPTKDWERNWGKVLDNIKTEMNARNSVNPKRWANPDDKDLFASAYVSLDAVRIAWCNTTMHVESKYTPDEAEHIFVAVRGLMKTLSSRMNESGHPKA